MSESGAISGSNGNGAAARRVVLNTGIQQVARIYSRALFGVIESKGIIPAAIEELSSVVTEVLDHYPRLEAILTSERVASEEKELFLNRLLGGKVSETILNFLKVMARHGRLNALRAIGPELQKLYDQSRGHVRVELGTAVPLEDGLAQRIADNLQRALGAQPNLVRTTDPDLLGGLVIRVGDTVYDGSVSTQLERLREQMIHRSVHEIQSRRDRFSHSEGN